MMKSPLRATIRSILFILRCVTNDLKTLCLNAYLLSQVLSVCQKFRNSLAGWFWLGDLSWGCGQDVIQVYRHLKFVWGRRVDLQDTTLTGLLAGASTPHHRNLSTGCLSILTTWWPASPEQVVQERVRKRLKCLWWPSFNSYMLSFLPYSVG